MTELERVPADEAERIQKVIDLTTAQMKQRYLSPNPLRRGVHPKDHGCVRASFKVRDDLPAELQVGIFSKPGREYDSWIRFSNASVLVGADSSVNNGVDVHGSRGMAIKVLGISGAPLMPYAGPPAQDFLMVNHPVFAIANVEDYQALSQILLDDKDNPLPFFARIKKKTDGTPDISDPATVRALTTAQIFGRLQGANCPPAFQRPPACPVDNRYFSGAPFAFGPEKAMKYSAKPLAPDTTGVPDVSDPNYLRTALHKRLTAPGAQNVVFEFMLQIRDAAELADKIDTAIEDACNEWDETKFPYVTVATVTIEPQDFDTDDRRAFCESLIYTPWHGVREHQPLGGINRLRRGVYLASSALRLAIQGGGPSAAPLPQAQS
jgi:hypothetical protein